MIDQDDITNEPDVLPEPIQLTPEQISDVAGGSVTPAVILRKGLPQAAN